MWPAGFAIGPAEARIRRIISDLNRSRKGLQLLRRDYEEDVQEHRQADLREGTPEFDAKCEEALRRVAEKYAWTAQQAGIVLRNNPLKLAPYQDYIFNRISRAEYGFRYRDKGGRPKVWFPEAGRVLAGLDEPEADFGFITAERIEFMPGQDEVTHDADSCRVLNLWRPPPWHVDEKLLEPVPFLEHVEYLLDGDREAAEHVLNFLAHLVQRPQERVGHALLITSEAKGIGKSTLGIIVRRLVGEQNSRVAQSKDLKSQFDGWLVGKLVVQVDEVYEAGNWDLANKLKPLITEPTVSVNVKYGPQLEIQNFARFILFSNHTAPLTIEEGDRRYFVFNSQAKPKEDNYYEQLHRYLETRESMDAIYSYLVRRDISSFNPYRRPPMTEAKQAVIEVSAHPLRTYIIEAVQSGHLRRHLGHEFSLDELQRLLVKDGYSAQSKNTKELGDALTVAGVERTRRTIGGQKRRRYVLPGSPFGHDEDEPVESQF